MKRKTALGITIYGKQQQDIVGKTKARHTRT